VYDNLRKTKTDLADIYGINNLSLIEEVRLKLIITECLKEMEKGKQEYLAGHLHLGSAFSISAEAITRWFDELYGLNIVVEKYPVKDEKLNEYIRRIRARAHHEE
ncbi:MAG: hypothetical protein CEN91_470, partial [Candidatus Berkelbacteria bacterium Licking1014_85]